MSFIDVIQQLIGISGSTSVEHPCRNCPSDCALAPDSCNVCKPYKEKLVDAIYNVEHIDEIRSKYVVSSVAQVTSVKCPYCLATSSSAVTCDYCGSALGGEPGKIVVASASDIPNPILEAQDIIFARYSAVKSGSSFSLDSLSSGDLLSQVFSLLGSESDESALGAKMTEDEIKKVAAAYGVSVADYLTGLDNGTYLTAQGKEAASQTTKSTGCDIPAEASVPGLAGMALGALLGTNFFGSDDDDDDTTTTRTSTSTTAQAWEHRPPAPTGNRPSSGSRPSVFDPRGQNGSNGMGMPGGMGGRNGQGVPNGRPTQTGRPNQTTRTGQTGTGNTGNRPGQGGPGGRGGMGGPGGQGGHGPGGNRGGHGGR